MYTLTLAKTILLAMSAGTLAAKAAPTNTTAGPQSANMTIVIYTTQNCNSNGTGSDMVPNGNGQNFTFTMDYDSNYWTGAEGNATFLSYRLSRPTTLEEQLDFSGPTPGMGDLNGIVAQCTLFHETASPDSNGHILEANQCYGLLLGPAEVSFLFPGANIDHCTAATKFPFTVLEIVTSRLTLQGIRGDFLRGWVEFGIRFFSPFCLSSPLRIRVFPISSFRVLCAMT